jgi:Na+/melibiose symporter-like transporter
MTEQQHPPRRSWWPLSRWFQEDGNRLELEPLKGHPKLLNVEQSDDSNENDDSVSLDTYTESSQNSHWEEFLFPSDRPREVQLLRWENIAIPCCYLIVGTMQGLVRPLLNVYPIDLGASEAQQTTILSIVQLPATIKILFGFVSDNYAIMGYRRKPYMLLGWTLASGIILAFWLSSDLSMSYDEDDQPIPPIDAPSLQWLGSCFFIFGIGMWMADVMADSLVAEKSRLEPEAIRGSLQSTCYACRFFGIAVAAPVSTYLYGSEYGPASIVALIFMIPLVMPLLLYMLQEERNYPVRPVKEQCLEIWNTVCSRSVWQPMAFMFVFNLMQVSNAAWKQFLKSVYDFSSEELNSLLVASYVFLYVGTMVYKHFFLDASWRRIYQFCILLNVVLSSLQLFLIRGITFGLSPFLFALGDDAFAEFIGGILFLPGAILMMSLCPPGSEGASYAMFTTGFNAALLLAPAVSTTLLGIWDVSKRALEIGELDGMFNLSILTTVIQMSPVLIIGWLPHGRDELLALAQKPYSGASPLGGGIFLAILFGSTAYAFTIAILNMTNPGWAGESR